jgi:hypothetical protein
VNLLIYYHLDHSVRCAVFQHRASGAVRRLTEDRPVLFLTQNISAHTLHFTYCYVLWAQHHCFCRFAIESYSYWNSPHISYYSPFSL